MLAWLPRSASYSTGTSRARCARRWLPWRRSGYRGPRTRGSASAAVAAGRRLQQRASGSGTPIGFIPAASRTMLGRTTSRHDGDDLRRTNGLAVARVRTPGPRSHHGGEPAVLPAAPRQDEIAGSLNLYSTSPEAFDQWGQSIGLLLASNGALVIANGRARQHRQHLQAALATNREIGVAIGNRHGHPSPQQGRCPRAVADSQPPRQAANSPSWPARWSEPPGCRQSRRRPRHSGRVASAPTDPLPAPQATVPRRSGGEGLGGVCSDPVGRATP